MSRRKEELIGFVIGATPVAVALAAVGLSMGYSPTAPSQVPFALIERQIRAHLWIAVTAWWAAAVAALVAALRLRQQGQD